MAEEDVVPVRGDAGTGLLTLAGGLIVFLVFLLFATQLLVGLYARSVVTAVASDAAQRAATEPATPIELIEHEARAVLGRAGADASFTWRRIDGDGDGSVDTVAVTVAVASPQLVPSWVSAGTLDQVERTVHVRIELS